VTPEVDEVSVLSKAIRAIVATDLILGRDRFSQRFIRDYDNVKAILPDRRIRGYRT